MEVGAEQVADSLRNVLRSFDVDEDTFSSLVEMVVDITTENNTCTTRALSAILEEQLEPFLLAFGAEPTSMHGSAMQIAIALRGMPDDDGETANTAKQAVTLSNDMREDVAKATTSKKGSVVANGKKGGYGQDIDGSKPSATLADLCMTTSTCTGKEKIRANAASENGGPPRSLGALWATHADPKDEASSVWKNLKANSAGFGDVPGSEKENGSDNDESDDSESAKTSPADAVKARQQKEKQDKRSKRVAAAAAAAAAAAPPTLDDDELGELAAQGLRETREAGDNSVTAAKAGRGTRGAHVEGKGSRVIHLEGVSLKLSGTQGSVELLREADLHLSPGHVYGFVGKNGSGKTTLLRRMAARSFPGMPHHLRFGYVAQELGALKGTETALEAVVNSDEQRAALLKERDELDALLLGADQLQGDAARATADEHARRFLEVEQQLEAIDASAAEDRAKEVLQWLNFDEANMCKPIASMSGGWRMRVALASALCARPDVLLLDEPTNHLDFHGVLWLQEHLRTCWGADAKKKDKIVLMVSHDRDFLDGCVTDIVEIHDCKLRTYPGNYSSYISRLTDEQKNLQKKKDEIEHQEQKAHKEMSAKKKKAREHQDGKKIRQLKAQEKKNERSFKLASVRELGVEGGIADDIFTKLREDVSLRFRFPEVEDDVDANLLEFDNAQVRRGSDVILRKLTVTLDPSSRVALVGANGQGKSTLMMALAGELKAEEGSRGRGRRHAAFRVGFVSQDHFEKQMRFVHANCVDYLREHLPDEKSQRNAPMTKQSEESILRAHLGNFGLGKDALKKVGYLSGGQRARLSLATATWHNPSVLLLDEPTNHLDVDSLDALSLGLQAFDGAVVVVSHNRSFLRALCDELWVIHSGTVKPRPRGVEAFDAYFAEYTKSVQAKVR